MKKILLIFAMSIVLISLISAADLRFEQNEEVILRLPCSFNGTFCTTAICNVSLTYPNGTYIIQNINMSNDLNGKYNTTLPSSNVLGVYEGFYSCTQATLSDSSTFTLEIGTTQREFTIAEAIIYVIFLSGATLTFVLFCYLAIKLPYNDHRNEEGKVVTINDLKYFKIFFIVISYILLMWIFGLVRNITDHFLILSGSSNFFGFLYQIMISSLYPIMIIAFIIAIAHWIEGRRMKKVLRSGFFLDDIR